MSVRGPATLLGIMIALSPSLAEAQVRVSVYTRSDGVYVRPHIRSAPDTRLPNSCGPARSSPLYSPNLPDLSVVTPYTRDHDGDGIAKMYDGDDDNDGLGDAYDRTQYGIPRRVLRSSVILARVQALDRLQSAQRAKDLELMRPSWAVQHFCSWDVEPLGRHGPPSACWH